MSEDTRRTEPTSSGTPVGGHEKTDINVWSVSLFGVALVIGAAVIYVMVWVLFQYFGAQHASRTYREYPLAPSGVLRMPPAPRLQEKPHEDLKALRAQEDLVLASYGWVDPASGAVRIPIDEAMKRVLQQGLPARAMSPDGGKVPAQPGSSNSGRTLEQARQ
jgi:hypothetical protein